MVRTSSRTTRNITRLVLIWGFIALLTIGFMKASAASSSRTPLTSPVPVLFHSF
ncbi:MAG: hypothetical protein HXY40_12860 [Chloroflexi bacterium]|nr:hypothetical protein [Chloroflexota bacterium]